MIFTSYGVFRKVVKTYDIMERRPIDNVWNYDKKVKYIFQSPRKYYILLFVDTYIHIKIKVFKYKRLLNQATRLN